MGAIPHHPSTALEVRPCQEIILGCGLRFTVATKSPSTHTDRHGDPQVRLTSHQGLTVHLNRDEPLTVVAW